jgi:CRP-like cAMP-binding protein
MLEKGFASGASLGNHRLAGSRTKEAVMIPKDILAKLSLFEGLPARALDEIGALAREESFPSRATIFSPEQASKDIYVLPDGSVRLTVFASPMSEPVTVTVLKTRGQAFSFSSVIGSGHHNSSAEAITDVRVIAVEGRPLMAYLAKEPAVGFLVMKRGLSHQPAPRGAPAAAGRDHHGL